MSIQQLQTIAAAGDQPVYLTASEGGELAAQGLIEVNTNETDPNNPTAYRVQLTAAGHDKIVQLQQQGYSQSQYNDPSQPAAAPYQHHEAPHNVTAPQAPQNAMYPSYQPQQNVQGGVVPSADPNPAGYSPMDGLGQQMQPQAPQQAEQPKPSFQVRADVPVPKVRRGGASNLKPRESQYPFDSLEINQSFHVPVTEQDQEPWKRMASNVSAANTRNEKEVEPREMVQVKRRKLRKDEQGNVVKDAEGKKVYDEFTEEVPKTEPTKKFIARRVDANDPDGAGVRIYRVPLDFQG